VFRNKRSLHAAKKTRTSNKLKKKKKNLKSSKPEYYYITKLSKWYDAGIKTDTDQQNRI